MAAAVEAVRLPAALTAPRSRNSSTRSTSASVDHERRQEAQRRGAGRVEHDARPSAACTTSAPPARRAGRRPSIRPLPAHGRQLARAAQPLEARAQPLAERGAPSPAALVVDQLERRQRGGGRRPGRRRRWMPWSPGSSTSAASPRGDAGADRQAAGERLGGREHVRPDRRLLERPQRSGPAHAALDLVEDQQRAAAVACLAGRREHRVGDRPDAASRPAPARSGPRRCARRPRARAPRGRRAGPRRSRARSGANGSCLVSCGVADSAPIVRPWKAPSSTTISPPRRRLRASLIAASLASAPELPKKTRASGAEARGEPLRQPRRRLRQVEVRGVQQPLRLLPDRLHDPRVAVARVADRDAGQEVEVGLALGVVESRSLAAHERHRLARVGVHHVRLVQRRQLLGQRAGRAGPLAHHARSPSCRCRRR